MYMYSFKMLSLVSHVGYEGGDTVMYMYNIIIDPHTMGT